MLQRFAGVFALVLSICFWFLTPASADLLDLGLSGNVERGQLGELEGRTLNYRVMHSRFITGRMHREWLVEVFFTEQQEEFDRLPGHDTVGDDPDEQLEGLSRDDMEVVYYRQMVGGSPSAPLFDPDTEELSMTWSISRDIRTAETTQVSRWSSEAGEFDPAYEIRQVSSFQEWAQLLDASEASRREEVELRLLTTDPYVQGYYGPNCDSTAGAVMFEMGRREIDAALDDGDEQRAHRLLSGLMRYRTSHAPEDITLTELPSAPVCGAVFDIDATPPGYGAGRVWERGAEVSVCAVERVEDDEQTCLEGAIDESWSGDQVRTAILDYAEFAASRGDEELALWLTLAMPTAPPDRHGGGRYSYEIETGDRPIDSIPDERVEEVVTFADAQHEARRTHLGAAYDRRLLDARRHFEEGVELPERIEPRADEFPAVERDTIDDPEVLAETIGELVAAGRPLEATGLLLLEFVPLTNHLHTETRRARPTIEQAISQEVYPRMMFETYRRAERTAVDERHDLAALYATFGLNDHPLALGAHRDTENFEIPDSVIHISNGLFVPLDDRFVEAIRWLQQVQ